MPRTDADLYICHNRGCSRVKWFTTEQKRRTCVFGSNEYYGVLNEEDKKCYSKDEGFICDEVPDVHFIFSKKMENCILRKT